MTQIKILVNNIQDVTHRATAETELNVYLKTGWKVQDTHQHMDTDNGTLMLTTIITKEGDETTESTKQETVNQKEGKNPVVKTDQQNPVKETGDKESKDTSTTSTEKPKTKEETSEAPKGFKIKEKKENSDTTEKEASSKTTAAKSETKESEEGESDEIEEFKAEEKTSEK